MPKETKMIARLLMLAHVLSKNTKDLYARVIALRPKTFVLILNKVSCHFEVHPDETPETMLEFFAKGSVCMGTLHNSVNKLQQHFH